MQKTMEVLSTVALSLVVAAGQLTGQGLEPRSLPSRDVDSYTYRSPTMGNRYDVSVGLPVGFRPLPGKKYPALIVPDGNLAFPIALHAARSLMEQGDARTSS